MRRGSRKLVASGLFGGLILPLYMVYFVSVAWAQEPPMIDWQPGSGLAPVGMELAEIELSRDYVYLDGEDTRDLMELTENPTSDQEVATIAPASNNENWFLVFEWDPIGYVKDEDEHAELDSEEILVSLKEANEAANEERRERGWTPLEIVGWQEPPFYDPRTQNLTWAVIGESEGLRSINRNIRLLGRKGVMHVTLVAGPRNYDQAVAETDRLLDQFRFRPGNKYAEFVPGEDHVAEIGLAALVTGGAAAAAAKSGLLSRIWKFLAAAVVAVIAGIKSWFGKLFGARGQQGESTA